MSTKALLARLTKDDWLRMDYGSNALIGLGPSFPRLPAGKEYPVLSQ
jgi:hypothetical protein